ncbi:MAG: zf-HC2 domain-containing protein [Candidatus Eremiobacteraeota bacterium]|nr:zf-HC2 domain-containing protein [Candidatus Eremiobacteraeota bacterium]
MNQEHLTTEDLMDYVHGELAASEDARVHAHLSGCSECSDARDAELQLSEILRDHAAVEERELPPGFADGVFDAIRAESAAPSMWERLAGVLRPAIALPVAAAIVLGIFFGFVSTHGTARANVIDASYFLEEHAELATTVPFDDGSIAPAELTSNDEAR